MGLLSRVERGPRAAVSGDVWRRILSGGGSVSKSGVRVNDDVALASAAVFACVRVVAEDVAKLPLILYRRLPEGGKERATYHPLYAMMHDRPNEWQTSFDLREMMQGHMELRGNAYAFVNRVRGDVRELIPLHPDRVTVKQRDDWSIEYDIRGDRVRSSREILHLRSLSRDGVKGLSTLDAARDAVGLSVATERHGSKLFANGARPSGVLTHPATISEGAAERLKGRVEEISGGENVHRMLLLEEDMKWEQMTMTSEDSQFLETRKFQVSEIARFWRIPPHKIGDLERATFSNIEHQALEYVTDSLMPRLSRWEQRLNRDLLNEQERGEFFFEFLTDALLRGDTKARFDSYKTAIDTGWMNPNEARALENMNPQPGLDEYRRPMNTEPVGSTPGGGR